MWRNYLSVRHVAFYRVPSDFCRPARCASDQWHIVALSYTLSRDTTHAGDTVELRGFGSFRLRHRQARAGRNPRTGDMVQIPAKAVPVFSAGKAFQALVQTSAAPSGAAKNGAVRR